MQRNAIRRIFATLSLICGLGGLAATPCIADTAPSRTAQARWARDDAETTASLIVNSSKQVYRILVELDGVIKGGTGFLVSGNRVVATNSHVLDKGTAYALGYISEQGQIRWVKLQVLAVFPQKDLALLEAQEDLPGQPFDLSGEFPGLASDLYAIGFPAAADLGSAGSALQLKDINFFMPSVVKGSVSRIMSGVRLTYQLQHQTPITAGYSGGPLLNSQGIVVGVSSAVHKDANGISYGVAAPDLARLLSACSLTPRVAHLDRFTRLNEPAITGTAVEEKQQPPSSLEELVVRRAYDMMKRGDIAGARQTFAYAAQVNRSRAAYEGLAKSYDPEVLKSLNVFGDLGDAKKAQEFYDQAQRTKSSGGPRSANAASTCNNDLCVMQEEPGAMPAIRCSKAKAVAESR